MSLKFTDLQVGMKILMRDDLYEGEYRDEPTCMEVIEEMVRWSGKIVTISRIDLSDSTFRIAEEDGDDYYWYWAELVERVVSSLNEKVPLFEVLMKGE